jgi:hypothetical protein
MKLKTLSKKNQTNENGIFYKEIVDENNKVVDKIFSSKQQRILYI